MLAKQVSTPSLRPYVELAALLAVGAATSLMRDTVAQASAEGSTTDEIMAVLVAVGPAVELAAWSPVLGGWQWRSALPAA
jgi:hypothetical protein